MKALYVTDRAAIGDERFLGLLAELSGVSGLSVELRERETTDRTSLAWARRARQLLGAGTPLWVNRRFDIALAADADGVHLPADGLPLPEIRTRTPRGFRIGVSAHSVQEAERAIGSGADQVIIGPIFSTPAKRRFGDPLGPEALGRLPLRDTHGSEIFAIGGVDTQTIDRLEPYRDRLTGVAGIRLFQEAKEPRAVVERIAAR